MTNNHRYLDDAKVAKLFATEPSRDPNNEVIYKAITQSLNAMIYYKNKPSFVPVIPYKKYNAMTLLNYPLIVVDSFDNFGKYDVTNKDKPERIKNNFQLEVRYAYFDDDRKSKNEFFLLDVLTLDNFEQFINELESKDIAAIEEKLL
jgi:hypothetical protein